MKEALERIKKICESKKYKVISIPNGMMAFKINPLSGHGTGKEVLWARNEKGKVAVVAKSKNLLIEIGCGDIHTIPHSGHFIGYLQIQHNIESNKGVEL